MIRAQQFTDTETCDGLLGANGFKPRDGEVDTVGMTAANEVGQHLRGGEINLDGGEVSIIKALGLSSAEMLGEDLIDKVSMDLMPVEIIDCMKGLIDQGCVDADKSSFYSMDEFKVVYFRVNSGYSKDLRDALDPRGGKKEKSKRVRRE